MSVVTDKLCTVRAPELQVHGLSISLMGIIILCKFNEDWKCESQPYTALGCITVKI